MQFFRRSLRPWAVPDHKSRFARADTSLIAVLQNKFLLAQEIAIRAAQTREMRLTCNAHTNRIIANIGSRELEEVWRTFGTVRV